MQRYIKTICFFALVVFLLSGCMVRTVDEMYCLPRRSETYNSLQSAINEAMSDLEYCAPISGANQQTVHMTDLDGDGMQEYLVFARESKELTLCILIFTNIDGSFVQIDTILCNGTAFDKVEYVQIDGREGMEIVVGRILSDPSLRTVSVYSLVEQKAVQMMSSNYSTFLTLDMDANGCEDLFLIRSGMSEADNGNVECYCFTHDGMLSSNIVPLSGKGGPLRQIVSGTLEDGKTAVFVASAMENANSVTDIFVLSDSNLRNLSDDGAFSLSPQRLWNYYVFPQDVDADGTVELPELIQSFATGDTQKLNRSCLVRWYSISEDLAETDKRYAFQDFYSGWYMEFDTTVGPMLTVAEKKQAYEFYCSTADAVEQNLLTVLVTTEYQGDPFAGLEGRFVLYKSETVTYSAILGPAAQAQGITQEQIVSSFHLIPEEWKIDRS